MIYLCEIAAADGVSIGSGMVQTLPQCSQIGAWQSPVEGAAGPAVAPIKDFLAVPFRATPGATSQLLLQQPVAINDRMTDFTFLCTNNSAQASLRVNVLVRDASGAIFHFETRSPSSYKRGVFHTEASQRRGLLVRFHVPGFNKPVLAGRAGANVDPPKPGLEPQRPWTLLGLEFVGERQNPADSVTWLYFKDFALTDLRPSSSTGYYLFDGQDHDALLEPTPTFTAATFGKWYGRRFEISWQVSREFAGQPVMAGSQTLEFPVIGWEDSALGKNYPVDQAQQIALPITEPGTWWVSTRARWYRSDKDLIPTEIITKDFRVDLVRGKLSQGQGKAITQKDDLPDSAMRFAPERNSLIWAANEKMLVPVRFSAMGKVPATACLVEVRRQGNGELVHSIKEPVKWDEHQRQNVTVDVSDQPAGAYRVRAALLAGDAVLDEMTCTIGKRGASEVSKSIPENVPSAIALRDGPKPLFPLTPMYEHSTSMDQQAAWDQKIKPFLDQASALSTDIQVQIPWAQVESLPGVYDWSHFDRIVDYAQSRGLRVTLWPEFRSQNVPMWIEGEFTSDATGRVFTTSSYVFQGGRPNYVFGPHIRPQLMQFIAAMVRHYKVNAAVTGYYYCYEHPGDASWANWYEGYEAPTVVAFVEYAKKNWKDLATINRRWTTKFAAWKEIQPPSAGSGGSDRFWADWQCFRSVSINGFLKGIVEATRLEDAHRLITVYGDGANDVKWFVEQGCMFANGGSHDAMQIPHYTAMGLLGAAQRTEDHSPGNWTAYFPTQPDASLFAMMTGGGVHTHVHAFVRLPLLPQDMADPAKSLGRYQFFEPIWSQLRATSAPPVDTMVLSNAPGQWLGGHDLPGAGTGDVWSFLNAMQAHVPVAQGCRGLWQQARLLVLPTDRADHMEQGTMDEVVKYVEAGGHLMMWADSGRYNLDDASQDWALLRRLGMPVPTGPCREGRTVVAMPVTGEIFSDAANFFTLRDYWEMPANSQGTTTAATIKGDAAHALMSSRNIGKGKVLVIWAQTALPLMDAGAGQGYSFWRDVARWANVQLNYDSDQPNFWLNLLEDSRNKIWFGLVHQGSWQNRPAVASSGHARWLSLPDGDYQVTELIHGKDLGHITGQALRSTGLKVDLGPREVAIFRMTRLATSQQTSQSGTEKNP